MILAKPPGQQLSYAPSRDLGHLFPYIFREAAAVTEKILQEEGKSLQYLNELTKRFIELYTVCLNVRSEGIILYKEILERCETNEDFQYTYQLHASVMQQLLFAVMFSSFEFPIMSSPLTDETMSSSSSTLFLCTLLSDSTRRHVIDELVKLGGVPNGMNVGALRRHIDAVVDKLRGQEARGPQKEPS